MAFEYFILYFLILGISALFDRASCLSSPCALGSWCIQGASSAEHACVQPTTDDCSFEEGLCSFNGVNTTITTTNAQNAISGSMPYYDHTFGICRGNKYRIF